MYEYQFAGKLHWRLDPVRENKVGISPNSSRERGGDDIKISYVSACDKGRSYSASSSDLKLEKAAIASTSTDENKLNSQINSFKSFVRRCNEKERRNRLSSLSLSEEKTSSISLRRKIDYRQRNAMKIYYIKQKSSSLELRHFNKFSSPFHFAIDELRRSACACDINLMLWQHFARAEWKNK